MSRAPITMIRNSPMPPMTGMNGNVLCDLAVVAELAARFSVTFSVLVIRSLLNVNVACQGPSGSLELSANVTGCDWPGASVSIDRGLNGPACRPPGPLDSDIEPRTSMARPPVWLIGTETRRVPFEPVLVVGVLAVKPGAGAPPGPMFRYMRIPTRLTRFTLPGPLASCSAQITPL